jgi:protein dithiol oxidoreductase (disulfide-forming)
MKMRYALALAALLPLMVACKAQDGTADVAPAPTTETTAPAVQAPADGQAAEQAAATAPAEQSAPAQDAAAAAPAPAPAAPQGPAPVEGEDYLTISGGVPFSPVAGKVEVVEIFAYTCPACFRFQSILAPWKSRLPADVNFVYMPAAFGGPGDEFARGFYASQTLGAFDKVHEPMYAAVQVERKLRGQSADDIAAVYGELGLDAAQVKTAMSSFGVNAQVARARQFAQRSQITGTPSLIVHGKYLVKGKSFEDMLRVADHLIARERAAGV